MEIEDLYVLLDELVLKAPGLSDSFRQLIETDAYEEGMVVLALDSFVQGIHRSRDQLPLSLFNRLEVVVNALRGSVEEDFDARALVRSFDRLPLVT